MFTESLAAFFGDFAEDVTAQGGTFPGLLDADYVGVGDVPVESTGYRLTVKSCDVATYEVAADTTLAINDVEYTVRGVQPDGTGTTVLILELA